MSIYTKISSLSLPKFDKDASNPHFKNKYITLDQIMAKIRPVLKEKGLLIYHSQNIDGLRTAIVDTETSEEISTFYPVPPSLSGQKLGSELTYARRYSICLLLGIVADEDDDGNEANKKEELPPPPPKPDMSKFINNVKIEFKANPTTLKEWCDKKIPVIGEKFGSVWERHCKFTVDQLCRDAFKIEPFYNITSNPTDQNGEPV
jgi:hypothetical protein